MYGIINHPTESPFFPNTPKSFDIESNPISIIYCKKRSNKLPHLLSVFSLRSSMMLISKCLIWDLGVGIWVFVLYRRVKMIVLLEFELRMVSIPFRNQNAH